MIDGVKHKEYGIVGPMNKGMKKDVTLEDLMKFMTEKVATKSDLEDLATKEDLAKVETRLEAKIDQVDSKLEGKIDQLNSKLGGSENSEVDKRKKLEVRVTKIERHMGLPIPDQNLV